MVYRSVGLYRTLGVLGLVVTLLVVWLGWQFEMAIRNALLITSLFFLAIACIYFHLGHEEARGAFL
ncbi:MAG: hypothetical protein IMW90_04785 [Thermogemmatispora sp.]|uniref:hypothetical protein n=1 Tax=Thermogemmatispora sp. TaxID=1968838 RepID=UPI0019FCF066|nr:hypothetical protein [Thermogemmatispora sp.]MBE3565023.1 hypothetical protein [Thermogemmatispora sp.]